MQPSGSTVQSSQSTTPRLSKRDRMLLVSARTLRQAASQWLIVARPIAAAGWTVVKATPADRRSCTAATRAYPPAVAWHSYVLSRVQKTKERAEDPIL